MKKRLFRIFIFLLILLGLDWGISSILRIGLERYYGLHQEADILIIGHSHLMKTCNKGLLEKGLGMKVSKYCREGVLIKQRHVMVQHFLLSQKDSSVPYVIYGVDPNMFANSDDLSTNSYKLFYPFMETPAMDEYVCKEASLWDYAVHKLVRCSRFSDTAIYRSARGWMNYWESLASGTISNENWNKPRPWKVNMPEENVRYFHETLDILTSRGAHVILLYPSIIKSYETSNPEAFAYMMNYFQTLADNHPQIDFLNYAPLFSHRQELFEDPVHLNRKGEALVTQQLIRDLQSIMSKKQPRITSGFSAGNSRAACR